MVWNIKYIKYIPIFLAWYKEIYYFCTVFRDKDKEKV